METGLRHRSARFSSSKMLSTTDLMNSERGDQVRNSVSNWANQDNSDKTFSRRFVEKVLLKVSSKSKKCFSLKR